MAPRAAHRRRKVQLRRATVGDVDLLVAHRLAMFREIGGRPERVLARHGRPYLTWLVPRLTSAEVVAWVAEDTEGRPVGSGGVWFQPSHPRPGTLALRTPYVLSMYTVPAARGRGIATAVVRAAVALSRKLGHGRVVLHASAMGRPVYERLGFRPTREMRLFLDPADRRRDDRNRAAEAARGGGRP